MNQFNNLPLEIIEFIFEKVDFNDLINLRTVDRRFKKICEQFKIKELAVNNYDHEYLLIWFYKNDSIYLNEETQIKISKFLNYKSIFRLDKYLRRLSIRSNENFNISILNEFKLLEQLQIMFKLNDNYELNLVNLKIADIDFLLEFEFKLTLNTNQLFAFKSSELDQFVFNYPDKILFYEQNNCNYNDDKIQNFINLEHLKIMCMNGSIDRDILSKFKNLKTLDLNIQKSNGTYDNLKNEIISILDEKENLRRSELQIYLYGVKLIDQNQLNQFKWSDNYKEFNNNVLEFQIKNYDLLKDNCCYMNKINYCELIRLIKIIPSSFTKKFPFIYQVKLNDHIDNTNQFFKFLNGLRYLIKLKLINCGIKKLLSCKMINLIYVNDLKYITINDKEGLNIRFDYKYKKIKNKIILINRSFHK